MRQRVGTFPAQLFPVVSPRIPGTVGAAARLSHGQPVYRNPHRSGPQVFSCDNDKGGVHPPYTGHVRYIRDNASWLGGTTKPDRLASIQAERDRMNITTV